MVIASPRATARGLIQVPEELADRKAQDSIFSRSIRQLQERSIRYGINVPASVTANYTATDDDGLIPCDATGGAVTVTLPNAAARAGKHIAVKKTDASANVVTITGGTASIDLTSQGAVRVYVSDGTVWQLLSSVGSASGLGNTL